MINKVSLWLTVIIITATSYGADKPVVDCKMSRITLPAAEYNGQVVCAASFVYGAYVENPTDQDDFLNSDELMEKFIKLPEEKRWQYPEYAVIKNFQAWKAGDKEKAISYYEPGYNREREKELQTQSIEKIQSIMKPFTRVVFIDRSYFGPYVRIYWVMSGVSESGTTKGERGFPGYSYLKYVDNRYMLTLEINMTNLFDAVASTYSYRKLIKKENITLNPDVSGMDWFAMDVDTASPTENKEWLKVYSTEGITDVPTSFSENYLKVYVKGEPVNVQLEAGKQANNLSEQMRFFESAVTATQMGNEDEILSKWSEKQRERISKDIQRIKDANEWPKARPSVSNFGHAPTVICLLPTSQGTVVYYRKKRLEPPSWVKGNVLNQKQNPIYTVGLKSEEGSYKLFNTSAYSNFNIFTNSTFVEAVQVMYGH